MANLGYQYDWPHRCYPKSHVPIPSTIEHLTKRAQTLYCNLSHDPSIEYHGEAVIVNYYKPKEYMIGHLDDGEEDQINPIFSFNFGLSAIFLLGFPDKNVEPIALKLEAGDLLSKCSMIFSYVWIFKDLLPWGAEDCRGVVSWATSG